MPNGYPSSSSRSKEFIPFTAILFSLLLHAGCGSGDEGEVAFSQEFKAPPGAKINENPNTAPPPTREEVRRKEMEISKAAAAKGKRRP
jgi:hypothetical protein